MTLHLRRFSTSLLLMQAIKKRKEYHIIITDLTPYRKYVDAFDMSDRQKLELVNTLRAIIESIMDQHFGHYQLEYKEEDTIAEIEPEKSR